MAKGSDGEGGPHAGRIDRRSVLFGSLAGVTAGGGMGFLSGSLSQRGGVSSSVAPFVADGVKSSYAQQGEDLVVKNILDMFGVSKPSYLDIGAHHPSINNNTYLFHKAGGRGVLVEPNPPYAELLRDRRKGDEILEAGIGVSAATEADYYMMRGDGQLNTFSKEQADELVKLNGPSAIVKVVKRPLLNINVVLGLHFSATPDFVSIDVEGLDYAILKDLDFKRYRPKVFCVETSLLHGDVHGEIITLMESNGYAVRGGSFVNTVFLDEQLRKSAGRDGGDGHGHGHGHGH